MQFNRLLPELSVTNINKTKAFYIDLLGFKLDYEREENKFIFLSFEGSQFMFEQIHTDGWNTAELVYPLGRGINFSIETDNIDKIYQKLLDAEYPLFRPMMTSQYRMNDVWLEQKQFLVQDPDGYLLRFNQE